MIQNRWLDYIEDFEIAKLMAYLDLLYNMKANKFFIIERGVKIEML